MGKDRTAKASPHRDYLANGVVLGGGVDGMPFAMLLAICSCVTRQTRDEGILGPEQRATVEEPVRMYTWGSAYVMHEEADKGSLERGKYGDLVVLDNDIFSCPDDDIRDTSVLATFVGGRLAWGSLP